MPLKQASFDFDLPPAEPLRKAKAVQASPESVSLAEDQPPVNLEAMKLEVSEPLTKKKTAGQRGRMRIADMDAHAETIEIPEDEILFEKRYYSISAVSAMFKVNTSLVRFWTNEFSVIKPKTNGKGDRLFRPEDIKNLHIIYQLLREKKYTIDGAKDYLKRAKYTEEKFAMAENLKKLKSFLIELKATL